MSRPKPVMEIPEGVPVFSHSQLQSWDRCRMSWKLSYVDGWQPKEKSPALSMGSTVHDFLALFYDCMKAKELNQFDVRLNEKVASMATRGEQNLEVISHAAWLVNKYAHDFAAPNDTEWQPVEVEKHFYVLLETPTGKPFAIQMYLDLLASTKGKLWLWDHKTHSSSPWNDTMVAMDPQLSTYSAILRQLGYDVFGVIINLLNTYKYKDLRNTPPDKLFKRLKSYRTQTELDNMLLEVGRSVDDVLDNRDNIRRSLQKDCSWCRYQEPCLMGLKGMDPEAVLEANFTKTK